MPSAAVDKDKEADATTSPLRVDDIDNVVDQLLERVPTSSSLGKDCSDPEDPCFLLISS